jgi:hypothetical protein
MTEQQFLQKLIDLDRSGFTGRDLMILHTIIGNPGICGLDVSVKLGLPNRSSIETGLRRLLSEHFIEDKRSVSQKAIPSAFYALPAGAAFWEKMKP